VSIHLNDHKNQQANKNKSNSTSKAYEEYFLGSKRTSTDGIVLPGLAGSHPNM
jgi:hypothetical protein